MHIATRINDTTEQVAEWRALVAAFEAAFKACKTTSDFSRLIVEHELVANYVDCEPHELEHLGIFAQPGATEYCFGYGELCDDTGHVWDGVEFYWVDRGRD